MIDIILPIYIQHKHQVPMTLKAIEAIEEHTLGYNLIIVESSDGRYFEDYADEYVFCDEPLNYSKKVNLGLKLSKNDYIVVSSNDVFVDRNWVISLLKCFRDKDCGIATLLSSQFNKIPKDEITFGFFGGLYMFKRKSLEDIGLLDERFVNSFEDADLWIRTELAGYKLLQNNSCIVKHDVSQTICHDIKHGDNFNMGRILFNEKHKDCGLKLFEQLR